MKTIIIIILILLIILPALATQQVMGADAEPCIQEALAKASRAVSGLRPISLLTLSLITLLESNFPGNSLGNPYGPGNFTPYI